MPERETTVESRSESNMFSRRRVLTGAAMTALALGAPRAWSASASEPALRDKLAPTHLSVRRYMAAAAALGDGRVLITGGYAQPFTGRSMPGPMDSTVILDPVTGQCWAAASMGLPRARHAAVTLPDGRVAVIGGMSLSPTASVEVYDPRSNRWHAADPLAQPRYDHSAVHDGGNVIVVGGSSLSMVTSVEVLQGFDGALRAAP